jgi:hypothetical protein
MVFTIYHYDFVLIAPLNRVPGTHDDARLPNYIISLIRSAEFSAIILQIIFNKHSGTFAGMYALRAYMEVARQMIRLLRFWPWFIGRHEARGGLGAITFIRLILDAVMFWQAWTLPRVEQVVPEDDE